RFNAVVRCRCRPATGRAGSATGSALRPSSTLRRLDGWQLFHPVVTPSRRRNCMNRLSQTLVRGNNNFDLLRLIAALMVMLGHSYGIQGGEMESMLRFSHLESFGSLAVYAFFMISGMLVSASFANQSSTFRFIG